MGLFATPLIKLTIDNAEAAADFFHANIKNKGGDIHQNSDHSNYQAASEHSPQHYHNQTGIFESYPQLVWLKDAIEAAGTFAYRDLLNYRKSGPMRITQGWFNLCDIGASQAPHNHANSLLSGTVYLHADEHTQIQFIHPLCSNSLHAELHDSPVQSENEYGLHYHSQKATVAVKTGDCLLWPSQMQHGYENNQTVSRLSFSFNLMPMYFNSVYQIY